MIIEVTTTAPRPFHQATVLRRLIGSVVEVSLNEPLRFSDPSFKLPNGNYYGVLNDVIAHFDIVLGLSGREFRIPISILDHVKIQVPPQESVA